MVRLSIELKSKTIKDYKKITNILDLLILEENLIISTDNVGKDLILSMIKPFLLSREVQIIQSVVDFHSFEKLRDDLYDDLWSEINNYFDLDGEISVIIDDSFWKFIIEQADLFVLSVSNGCGNDIIDAPELIFKQSCDLHDGMYQLTDSEKEKLLADDLFLDNMLKLAKEQHGSLYPLYKLAAKLYYQAVYWFGKSSTQIS